MRKQALRVFLSSLFICLTLLPAAVRAESGISILETGVEVHFPASLAFHIEVDSKAKITDIRLQYQVERMNFIPVFSEAWPEFTPSQQVKATWLWDTRKASLPPGAQISYWWSVENEIGEREETLPKVVSFDDVRYPWRRLTEGNINLFWYHGDEAFARELLDACQEAQLRLAQEIITSSRDSAGVYIYTSADDLRGALVFPNEWTGGIAFTEYGIIVLGVPTEQLAWGKRALAHEFTHLVVHQLTFGPYIGSIPVWLDEGLAVYYEGEPDPYFESYLEKAVQERQLISLRSLSSPFSARGDLAVLSYAQSWSVVDFLITDYGGARMHRLLTLLSDGATIDEALLQAYSFDQEKLDRLWRESVGVETEVAKGLHPSFIILLVIIGTMGILIAALIIERRTWKR